MKAKVSFLVISLLFFILEGSFAYFEKYPPYKFDEVPFPHLETEELVNWDRPSYELEEEGVSIYLKDRLHENEYDFYIKENGLTLMEYEDDDPFAYTVFRSDLDKNGLQDCIIFSSHRGCGLAAHLVIVDIILKKNNTTYKRITYETFFFGLEDFVDLDKDGKYEVITTDMYGGKGHNYWAYNIYEFDNYQLINANKKHKGFPKFIWFTYKENDKDTTHLTEEEKAAFIEKANSAFTYRDIQNTKK